MNRAGGLVFLTAVTVMAFFPGGCKDTVVPPDRILPDTTSHAFVWRVDTLGDGGSSVINDVFIIDENNIWAVGEIYLKDSAGQFDPQPYGLAKWNGSDWNLTKVPYHDFGSTSVYPGKLSAIHAFGANDVYVSSSANLLHWNGSVWTEKAFFMTSIPFDGQVTKMWGTNASNLYCVGRTGAIYHFDGISWEKIESGADVPLTDVWGSSDGKTVWACGWEDFKPTVLLRVENGVVSKQYEDLDHQFVVRQDSLSGRLVSGAAFGTTLVILSPPGLYFAPFSTQGEGTRTSFVSGYFPGFPSRIRGNALNDLVIVGQRSMIAHYNGGTWLKFAEFNDDYTFFNSVGLRGNTVAAVGTLSLIPDHLGLVFIGRR